MRRRQQTMPLPTHAHPGAPDVLIGTSANLEHLRSIVGCVAAAVRPAAQ